MLDLTGVRPCNHTWRPARRADAAQSIFAGPAVRRAISSAAAWINAFPPAPRQTSSRSTTRQPTRGLSEKPDADAARQRRGGCVQGRSTCGRPSDHRAEQLRLARGRGYDPAANEWTSMASMPLARHGLSSASRNRLLIAGAISRRVSAEAALNSPNLTGSTGGGNPSSPRRTENHFVSSRPSWLNLMPARFQMPPVRSAHPPARRGTRCGA